MSRETQRQPLPTMTPQINNIFVNDSILENSQSKRKGNKNLKYWERRREIQGMLTKIRMGKDIKMLEKAAMGDKSYSTTLSKFGSRKSDYVSRNFRIK